MRVVDLSADFRLRDPAVYEEWYREHPAPELLGAGGLRAARAATASEIRGRRAGRQPGLLSDRGAARAGAARPRGADRGRGDRRQVGRLGRRARRHREDPLRHRRRERQRLRRPAPPPHARDRAGARDCSAPSCGSRSRRTCCRSTRASSCRCYVTPSTTVIDGPELEALYADAYASEPFVELADEPPGVRDVRETNICRISVHRDERTGRVIVFARDRQPVEGRRLAGGPEPQPDVRAAGGGGDRVTARRTRGGR